jgi:hypothetical protein
MGFRQSFLERDSLGFGCNELRRVEDSHGPEEIRWLLVLDGNQNFGGKSLSRTREGKRKKSEMKFKKVIPNGP